MSYQAVLQNQMEWAKVPGCGRARDNREFPAYSCGSNIVMLAQRELVKFVEAPHQGYIWGGTDEVTVARAKDLISRAMEMRERRFDNEMEIAEWLLDLAILSPHLWD